MLHKVLSGFVIILVISGIAFSHMSAAVNTNTTDAWTHPNAKSMVRVGPAPDIPEQPNFLSNTDCTEIQYRDSTSGQLAAGCFTETAFGMVDSDSELVIYNGTDEALPLEPYTTHQVLAPWTRSGVVLSLDAVNTGGSMVSMYKNISAELINKRALNGQLQSKQVGQPPDIVLRFNDGQALIINPQTLAFSSNGSWMIAETLRGAFVRVNLTTLDVTPFAQSYASTGSPALLKSVVSVSNNGQFVAVANSVATSFRVYDLGACSVDLQTIASNPCPYFEYWPFVSSGAGSFSLMQHLRFIDTGLLSFELVQPSGRSIFELSPTAGINSFTSYIGLGDSYSSGEGAFDYLAGTDTTTNMCHLSIQSYPLILSRSLFGINAGHSIACSGAVIGDITPSNPSAYRGQVASGTPRNNLSTDFVSQLITDYAPGILSQQEFVARYQPKIITVGVGGNDIGFGDLLQTCVEPHVSMHMSDNICFGTYEDRIERLRLIDRTVPRWVALYKQLAAQDPQATIYAIGYPQIAVDTGKCGINVHLSKSELEFAQELVDYLNKNIAQAATSAGVTFVDIRDALAGHRLCETAGYNSAVNGLTSGSASGTLGINFLGKESYHPNAFGQQLMAQAILKSTDNLKSHSAITLASTSSTITQAPKSNRAIHTLVPSNIVPNRILKKGSTSLVQISGQSIGLQPKSVYRVIVGPVTSQPIETISTDGADDIDASVIIPISSVTGGTVIHVVGPSANDTELDIYQVVYIAENDSDYDGDGLVNESDSCPFAVNSGTDEDKDGVDDTCDPIIGTSNADNGQQIVATTTQNNTPITSNNSSGSTALRDSQSSKSVYTKTVPRVASNTSGSTCIDCGVLGAATHKSNLGHSVSRFHILTLLWPWWLVVPLLTLISFELLATLFQKIWGRYRPVFKRSYA